MGHISFVYLENGFGSQLIKFYTQAANFIPGKDLITNLNFLDLILNSLHLVPAE